MVPSVVLMEVSKAYRQWCNLFLRRMIVSGLVKMAAALCQIGKDPDLSHMDHRWRASTTFKPCGDHSIARLVFSCLVYDF